VVRAGRNEIRRGVGDEHGPIECLPRFTAVNGAALRIDGGVVKSAF
jgi:hypothetical protein